MVDVMDLGVADVASTPGRIEVLLSLSQFDMLLGSF
jgi:hypothetical protein